MRGSGFDWRTSDRYEIEIRNLHLISGPTKDRSVNHSMSESTMYYTYYYT